ncbi:MAG: 3'-5' exonuclease [Syntrophobacteraceae bacterium]|jgi:hypothetical protein
MAMMIPDYTSEFTTEGERRFYEFLSAFAKPDDKFTTWYLPDIEGREPDFILYCENLGLIIFEVKDWALGQIDEADPHSFVLRVGNEKRRTKSPFQQARDYLNSLMSRIKADGRLISNDPKYFGNPKIPIDCGVVFPNINKYEYCRRGLEKVIDAKRIFFRDDLHLSSEICTDNSGRCFQKKLAEMFTPKFQFRLSSAEYSHLKKLLFPVIQVRHTQRDSCVYVDPTQRVHVLDDKQEAIARRQSSEINLIKGPAGSGKTLVLVHRAAFLKAYRPEARLLFLCYNITLTNYIKRLISEKEVGLGPGGVEVYHFYELCAKILGEEIQCEKEDEEYYQLVVEETCARLRGNPINYHAVLIDEGQDFSSGMLKVVAGLLDPESPNLTVAIDEGQNIYGGDILANLREIADNVREDELPSLYRNTVEIRNFAMRFMGWQNSSSSHCDISGPAPKMVKASDLEAAAVLLSDTVKTLHAHREYPFSEIAVLYPRRISRHRKLCIPELVMHELENRGIMSNWISEDLRSKQSYDITTERVSISTIHSAKGFDWACVFLLGLDELEADEWSDEQIRKLTYVALTRARHRLVIPYVRKNGLIENLLGSL